MKPLRPATGVALAALLVLAIVTPAQGRPGVFGRSPVGGSWDGVPRSAKPLPALTPIDDALTRALERGSLDEATYALERARSVFDLKGVRERYGRVRTVGGRDATPILRDLVARIHLLSPAERRTARALLARPTDGASDPQDDGYTVAEEPPLCTVNGCIHYVATTDDAPDPADTDPANGIPDYVDAAALVFEEVWAAQVTDRGYRPPKSDETSVEDGGNELVDVYVAELGDQGLYGYCTTDDPNFVDPGTTYRYGDASAYCVVDNDYREFPPSSRGLDGLRVTLAHEFFHAIQFAYDVLEDRWFMESTATWMEDELYDDIDDSLQYLSRSPLGMPHVPLDANNRPNVYGAWIFPRFLVESSGDADLIRRVWTYADASPGGRDLYAIKAYAKVIGQVEVAPDVQARFRWAFADFGFYNDAPEVFYEEGAGYPVPPYARRLVVTGSNRGGDGVERLDHLTNAYVGFVPGRGVGTRARLAISVDGPPYRAGTEATVVVVFRSGKVKPTPLPVDRKGRAEITVPFRKGVVAAVDLVLTNASIRLRGMDCWVDPRWAYSCAGVPADDDLPFAYSATLLP